MNYPASRYELEMAAQLVWEACPRTDDYSQAFLDRVHSIAHVESVPTADAIEGLISYSTAIEPEGEGAEALEHLVRVAIKHLSIPQRAILRARSLDRIKYSDRDLKCLRERLWTISETLLRN